MTTINIGRVRMSFKGAWDNATAYVALDTVEHNGSSYAAIQDVPVNTQPPNATYWALVAQAGADGADGADGLQGPTGPQGPQGIQGIQGDTGDTGPTGPQGPQGPVGNTGATGATGPQGPQGDTGTAPEHSWLGTELRFRNPNGTWASYTDLEGPQGTQGPQGNEGPQGPAGPQGIQGVQGDQGPTPDYEWGNGTNAPLSSIRWKQPNDTWGGWVDLLGPQGNQGPQGNEGPQGPQGVKGSTGATGPQGIQGPVGPEGPMGPEGPTGPQGPTGATGAQGAQGEAGPMGPKVAYGSNLTTYAADAANTGDIYFHSNGNVYQVTGVGTSTLMGAWELDASTVAGLQSDIDSKLPSSSYTAADVLAKIKTVDGQGSGLDADLLDGQGSGYFLNASYMSAGTLNIARLPVATQAEAEAGTSTTKVMTPQRVAQAIADQQDGLGYGQTWQRLEGSRSYGTNYQNTTGRPIWVFSRHSNANTSMSGHIGAGTGSMVFAIPSNPGVLTNIQFIVPDGWYYRIECTDAMNVWSELR